MRTKGAAEDEVVGRLCSLGFSVAAVRHALATCQGRAEEAGLWLINGKHADEIRVAERVMAAASQLRSGGSARICGLRGAVHLTGVVVMLEQYDGATQRWVVRMPDTSQRSIRPQNLDAVDKAIGAQRNVHELRAQVVELVGVADRQGAQRVPREVSAAKLSDVIDSMPSLSVDACGEVRQSETVDCLAGTACSILAKPAATDYSVVGAGASLEAEVSCAQVSHPILQQQGGADNAGRSFGMSAEVGAKISTAAWLESSTFAHDDGEVAKLRQQLQEQAAHIANLEAQSRNHVKVLEAALSETESRCRAEEVQMDAESLGVGNLPRNESVRAASNVDELHEERRELQALRAVAAASASAALELEEQQESRQKLAQDHELQLLEEEAALHRLRNDLQHEQARVDHERRSVLLLQQSLLESLDSARGGGTLEVALDKSGGAAEVSADESDVAEEVWDLDWCAVGGKESCGEAPSLAELMPNLSQDTAPPDGRSGVEETSS